MRNVWERESPSPTYRGVVSERTDSSGRVSALPALPVRVVAALTFRCVCFLCAQM